MLQITYITFQILSFLLNLFLEMKKRPSFTLFNLTSVLSENFTQGHLQPLLSMEVHCGLLFISWDGLLCFIVALLGAQCDRSWASLPAYNNHTCTCTVLNACFRLVSVISPSPDPVLCVYCWLQENWR